MIGSIDAHITDLAIDRTRQDPDRNASQGRARQPQSGSEPQSKLRVTIDRSENGLFYVYTLRERETGRVITQLPRDDLALIKDQPGYQAGTVLNTEA